MLQNKAIAIFNYVDKCELGVCLFLNQASHKNPIKLFFSIISRLGNGVFWYVLMLLLPLIYGLSAWQVSLHMACVAVVGVLIYKLLKQNLVRQRPFITHASINLGTAPLDEYSFPSGHTLHAVSFLIIALNYYPELAFVLIPFTILVALSRVILGLHYPSDVLVGAAIGFAISFGSIQFLL